MATINFAFAIIKLKDKKIKEKKAKKIRMSNVSLIE